MNWLKMKTASNGPRVHPRSMFSVHCSVLIECKHILRRNCHKVFLGFLIKMIPRNTIWNSFCFRVARRKSCSCCLNSWFRAVIVLIQEFELNSESEQSFHTRCLYKLTFTCAQHLDQSKFAATFLTSLLFNILICAKPKPTNTKYTLR